MYCQKEVFAGGGVISYFRRRSMQVPPALWRALRSIVCVY